MFDLISIGNISMDFFFKGDSLTFRNGRFQLAVGGKYFSDYFHESLGGGGANVAIGGSRNGIKTAVLGKIGENSFKKIILEKLHEEHVAIDLCQAEKEYLNISAILLSPKGERSIINYNTPHQHICVNESIYADLKKTTAVYMGNLPDVSLNERHKILTFLKRNSILKIVNLGVSDCRRKKDQIRELLEHVDILIVNGHEFAELVKAPYEDIHFKENVVKWYIPFLKEKIIIVTEGSKGSYVYQGNEIFHQPAVKPAHIVDTTGAGDAYTAAFIARYLKTFDIESSMRSGAHYASHILTKIGAN